MCRNILADVRKAGLKKEAICFVVSNVLTSVANVAVLYATNDFTGTQASAVRKFIKESNSGVEIVFDQGIGDIFSARVAGNVLNDDIVGSMEFGCKVAGAKLIAVIGHSNCGAIKGAVDEVKLGNLTGLLNKVQPAIKQVPADVQPRNSKNLGFVDKVAEANVRLVMKQIRERSPILREMIDQNQIGLVGGMYDISTGGVHFFDK